MASPYKDHSPSKGSFLVLLDISKLQLVRDALKSAKFTDADWFDLGLKLGLEYSDLKSIEKDKDSNSTRLRECLGVWLSSNSVCTWEMLASALEELDRAAAEHIRKKYGDPASQILQNYSTRISKIAFNSISIQLLYTEGLIMEESQKKIEGCGGFLVADVIKEILSNVFDDHSKLIKLGNILLKSKEGAPVAEDMLKDCKHTFAPDLNSLELNPSVSSVSVKGATYPPTSGMCNQ
uniref:Death domain-containing protein n=1 Tax=Amphimedon queenslandica TaxID=400682 RepID=A0A1X7SK41_AMPQE